MDDNRILHELQRLAALAEAHLSAQDWHGPAGEIAQTGEEDPLAMVDDPDLREVIAAKMAMRRSPEPPASYQPDQFEQDFATAIDRAAALGEQPSARIRAHSKVFESLTKAAATFIQSRRFDEGNNEWRVQQLSMLVRFREIVEHLRETN